MVGMFPKEHGAYGQLLFPLATSLLVTGVTGAALLTAVAACAAFLSHEPLLVLLGRRGPRAARETGRQAMVWWSISAATAVGAGCLALWLTPAGLRWAFAYPLVPVAIFGGALAIRREKTAIGELSAAAAFSSLAIPMCRVSGAPASTAFAVAVVFLGVFLASTLAVRVVILAVRGGGDAAAVSTTRRAFFVVVGSVLAGLVVAGARGELPWAPLLAVAPSWLVATTVAVKPPRPARLKTIGWTLMSASLTAALILVVVLSSPR